MNPDSDFEAFFQEFDTVLMGRATDLVAKEGAGALLPGMKAFVCSEAYSTLNLWIRWNSL